MSIQANFPALKPTLLLDFANVKALDPRITFTRASEGRYYDGKTFAMAEQNLLLQSQNYSATWTVTNLTPVTGKTAPDSTSTATEFTAGAANAVLTQGYTAIAGSYTFSVWLRRVTGTGDIQIASDNGTWTTKALTGTWARYDVTQTVAAGSKTAGVRVVTSGDVIEIWGAQLEQRSAVTSYTATTTQPITNYIPVLMTAANGVARFDHNPVTEESLGLLIEEQRTNLLTYSEQFDNAAWTKTNSSITSNTIVAPDGTLTGDKLVEDTANGEHRVGQAPSFTSGLTYTATVYVKAAERTLVRFGAANTTTFAAAAFFNVATGVVTSTSFGSASISAVGNGWYRLTIVGTAGATAATTLGVSLVSTGTTTTYTGDGYSGIYIWGAQLESGAFPTSYIPTVAAQVTRSADAASMTGTNFSSWYRPDEGTIYCEAKKPSALGSANAWSVSDNSFNNRQSFIYVGVTSLRYRSITSNITDVAISQTVSADDYAKAAGAYKTNDFAFSTNGGASGTDTSGLVPVVSQLNIGADFNTNVILNGHIRKIAYYPTRLSNANLQALTS